MTVVELSRLVTFIEQNEEPHAALEAMVTEGLEVLEAELILSCDIPEPLRTRIQAEAERRRTSAWSVLCESVQAAERIRERAAQDAGVTCWPLPKVR